MRLSIKEEAKLEKVNLQHSKVCFKFGGMGH